jgi:hypothetical protein
MEVPKWFTDPEAPRPCPCGYPAYGRMLLFESDDGGKIIVHVECAAQAGLLGEDDGD